jgi:hypothetical protein
MRFCVFDTHIKLLQLHKKFRSRRRFYNLLFYFGPIMKYIDGPDIPKLLGRGGVLRCVAGELSQHLISSFKYLGPHFHSLTAGLGIVNMSMHGNNGESLHSLELRMHLFFFHTRKHHRLLKASRFQHGNDENSFDGSKLNTDSI